MSFRETIVKLSDRKKATILTRRGLIDYRYHWLHVTQLLRNLDIIKL